MKVWVAMVSFNCSDDQDFYSGDHLLCVASSSDIALELISNKIDGSINWWRWDSGNYYESRNKYGDLILNLHGCAYLVFDVQVYCVEIDQLIPDLLLGYGKGEPVT